MVKTITHTIKSLFPNPKISTLIENLEHNIFFEKICFLFPRMGWFFCASHFLLFMALGFMPSSYLPNGLLLVLFFNAVVFLHGMIFTSKDKIFKNKQKKIKNPPIIIWQNISQFCNSLLGEKINYSFQSLSYVLVANLLKPLDIDFQVDSILFENTYFDVPSETKHHFEEKRLYYLLDNFSKMSDDERSYLIKIIDEQFGLATCFSIAIISNNLFLFKLLIILNQNTILFNGDLFKDNTYIDIYQNNNSFKKGFIYEALLKSDSNTTESKQKILSLFDKKSNIEEKDALKNNSAPKLFEQLINSQSNLVKKNQKTNRFANNLNSAQHKPIEKKIVKPQYVMVKPNKEVIYSYDDFKAMRYELVGELQKLTILSSELDDSQIFLNLFNELNFIIKIMNEEHFKQVNVFFEFIVYIKEILPSFIQERKIKEQEIDPNYEYQYHEQIKEIQQKINQTQQIVFDYPYAYFKNNQAHFKQVLHGLTHMINQNKDWLKNYDSLEQCINHFSFIIEHINDSHYERIRHSRNMNLVYLIEHYFPYLMDSYVQASFKKKNTYYFESQINSIQKNLAVLHEIIVIEASDEYKKNSSIMFNKYAEFNFTYLKANQ